MAYLAPFETFKENYEREISELQYNDEFIKKCREKALEYDKYDQILRCGLLQELNRCLPLHRRSEVFSGISNWQYSE